MPWGHRHREQEEAYVVVAGSGRAKLDEEIVELIAWDVRRVAPAVVRSFEAGPEGLDLICIGGRKPKGGDTERFPDFWDSRDARGCSITCATNDQRPQHGQDRHSGEGSALETSTGHVREGHSRK
jgi:hypothetical protein